MPQAFLLAHFLLTVAECVGVGLVLASAVTLITGGAWSASAVRDRWTTRMDGSPHAMAGEAASGLDGRAAALFAVCGVSLQVLGRSTSTPDGSLLLPLAAAALVLTTVVSSVLMWRWIREYALSRRLVALALGSRFGNLSEMQFLGMLDDVRPGSPARGPGELLAAKPGLVVAERLTAVYGHVRAFHHLEIER